MNLQEPIRVYDYVEGRNTVPIYDRYNFDVDKLVNAGVVFITPAIDGDPKSPTYKEWLDEDGAHLITLYNIEHSSPNGWIRKAITKKSDTLVFRHNFIEKLYDGKYNQILWGLEKLGIDPNDMVIENNSLQENIHRIKEVMGLILEQSVKTVSIRGKQSTNNTDWDLVHGILGSNRLNDDLESRVGSELKNGNYRVTNVTVTSRKVGNEIITDGTVNLTPVSGNELPHSVFTTRGSIGADYESRHDGQVNGLPDRLKSFYKGDVSVFGPYMVNVEGTNVNFKQSFFAVEINKQ